MKKNIIKILLIFFLALGFSADGMASPDRDDLNRPPSKEQMEKVRKRIETMRIWKLTKALDLDEKTAARLFPLLNKYDKKRAEIERDIKDNMKNLRDALEDKKESKLRGLLERLEKNHKALQGLNDEERAELKHILTVGQQAKYLIFLQEFNREIRHIIAEARERRHGRFGRDRPEEKFPDRPFPRGE